MKLEQLYECTVFNKISGDSNCLNLTVYLTPTLARQWVENIRLNGSPSEPVLPFLEKLSNYGKVEEHYFYNTAFATPVNGEIKKRKITCNDLSYENYIQSEYGEADLLYVIGENALYRLYRLTLYNVKLRLTDKFINADIRNTNDMFSYESSSDGLKNSAACLAYFHDKDFDSYNELLDDMEKPSNLDFKMFFEQFIGI